MYTIYVHDFSNNKHFFVIWYTSQELSVDEPCSCVCMADSFVIVGTDRFYKINLDHPSLTGILDIFVIYIL